MTLEAERLRMNQAKSDNASGAGGMPEGDAFAPSYSSSALWYGILAGPVVWLSHLFATYAIATVVCAPGQVLALHISTLVAAVIAVSAGLVAWRARSVLTAVDDDQLQTISHRRARFLALFGIGSSAIFLLAILVQSVPNLFLDPCRALG